METTKTRTIIGLDLGMGNTKIWTPEGGKVIASQVAKPLRTSLDLKAIGLSTGKKSMSILNGAGRLIVGEGAHDQGQPIERLDYDKLAGSPELKALVYAAFTSAQVQGDLSLFVGLPLGMATSKARVDAVKDWLTGAHVWRAGAREHVTVAREVKCLSQAMAAYFDWMLDETGRTQNKPGKGEEIGVISIGFNTIEMTVFRDQLASKRFTAGLKEGVRQYLEAANADKGGHYTLGELDTLMRDGALEAPQALATWSAQVRGHIDRAWGDEAQRFSKVIAVGGGALLLADAMREHFGRQLVTSDEPILSVARGLYKIGLNQAK